MLVRQSRQSMPTPFGGELAAELDRHEGAALDFEMDVDHETGPGTLWMGVR